MRTIALIATIALSSCASGISTRGLSPGDARVTIERDSVEVVFPRIERERWDVPAVQKGNCATPGIFWNLEFESATDQTNGAPSEGDPLRLFTLGVFVDTVDTSLRSLTDVLAHAGQVRGCTISGYFRMCGHRMPARIGLVDGRVTWRMPRTAAITQSPAGSPTHATLMFRYNCDPPIQQRVALSTRD